MASMLISPQLASSRSSKKRKAKPVVEAVQLTPKKVKFEDKPPEVPTTPDKISNVTLGWTSDDLNSLINNLAKCLPKNDSAKYSTLIEKLDWDKVKFGTYTAQQCKDKWFEVMNRLRRYRTLTDMVSDARVWLKEKVLSENKLKQQQSLSKLQTPLNPEQTELFRHRVSALQKKHLEKIRLDLMKIKQKPVPKAKPSAAQQNLMKREPKRPPKSGYSLFTSEQLSSLTDFEPKKRMQEIARKWNQELTKEDKENYDIRIKQLNADYQKKLLNITASLNPTELMESNGMKDQTRVKTRLRAKSAKSVTDPVVDDSNVIETVDISTSGDAANTSDDESDDEDSDNEGSDEEKNEEKEEEEQPQQEGEEEADDSDDESEEEGDDDDEDEDSSD